MATKTIEKKTVTKASPKTTAKTVTKDTAAKTPAKAAGKKIAPKEGGKPNALQQPLTPSKELAEVVGSGKMARGEVVSKVWEYIKKHDLQNPKDKREILADKRLEVIFGKKKCTMFEMNKYLAQHLS